MFIRVKKRWTKSGKIRAYAYIVASRLYKKGPRQKVKRYLGRVYAYPRLRNSHLVLKKDFKETIMQLLMNELEAHGFNQEANKIINEEGIVVDLKNYSIKDRTNKNIGISLNHGVCCEYTLKRIIMLKNVNQQGIELGKLLGKYLLEAGFDIEQTSFISLFHQLQTISNNDQQSSTMPNNAKQ